MRNDLDVFAYVKDVLDRLLAGDTDYGSLRPDVSRAAHLDAIRTYREEERAARADVKKTRRARRRTVRQEPFRGLPIASPRQGKRWAWCA